MYIEKVKINDLHTCFVYVQDIYVDLWLNMVECMKRMDMPFQPLDEDWLDMSVLEQHKLLDVEWQKVFVVTMEVVAELVEVAPTVLPVKLYESLVLAGNMLL